MRPGQAVAQKITRMPCCICVVEMPSGWIGDLHQLTGPLLVRSVPVYRIGDVVTPKPTVAPLRALIPEDVVSVDIFLFHVANVQVTISWFSRR